MTSARGIPPHRGLEVRRFIRANASAVTATALDWFIVTALVALGVHYLIAAASGALAGAVADFWIKRHWAFMRGAKGAVHQEASRYVFASAISLGLNLVASYTFVDLLHFASVPGVIIASIIVGIAWNYPVHRFFVFPEQRSAQ